MKLIDSRSVKLGVIAAAVVGLVVTVPIVVADWRLNPGGIFHDEDGTNWSVVLETAVSWLWPVALLTFVLVTAAHYGLARISRKENR